MTEPETSPFQSDTEWVLWTVSVSQSVGVVTSCFDDMTSRGTKKLRWASRHSFWKSSISTMSVSLETKIKICGVQGSSFFTSTLNTFELLGSPSNQVGASKLREVWPVASGWQVEPHRDEKLLPIQRSWPGAGATLSVEKIDQLSTLKLNKITDLKTKRWKAAQKRKRRDLRLFWTLLHLVKFEFRCLLFDQLWFQKGWALCNTREQSSNAFDG